MQRFKVLTRHIIYFSYSSSFSFLLHTKWVNHQDFGILKKDKDGWSQGRSMVAHTRTPSLSLYLSLSFVRSINHRWISYGLQLRRNVWYSSNDYFFIYSVPLVPNETSIVPLVPNETSIKLSVPINKRITMNAF